MSRSYKRKAVDIIQSLTPSIYKEEDGKLSENSLDMTSKVIIGDIQIIKEFQNINRTVSADAIGQGLAGWDATNLYASGLLPYFVRQNKKTVVTPDQFELEILFPLGASLKNYDTSSQFFDYVSGTLYPMLRQGTGTSVEDIYTATNGAYGNTNAESHRYLRDSLGLLYFMMNEECSSVAIDLISNNIYNNQGIYLVDCMKGLKRHIWENNLTSFDKVLTPEFVSGTTPVTSGTQGIDRLRVWTDVLYSEDYREKDDTYVRDVIENYFNGGPTPEVYLNDGPLYRFQRAVSFLIADIDNQILSLETLMSINECPAEYLPYLADLVGWKFYTTNVDSWRRQLRDSRELLQKKGTRRGLQDLLRSILPSFELNFSSNFSEYYESYVPNLIYYLLKTESSILSSFESWSQELANAHAGSFYNAEDLDLNIRYVVDQLLLEAATEFPYLFNIGSYPFNLKDPKFVFFYRNRDFKVPPWEYENFYKDCDITFELANFFKEKLICLGVPATYCESFESYILENTVSGVRDVDLYNNGMFFLTKNYHLPPNYQNIIDEYQQEKFDYLPMWNGKSSHFNLSISSLSSFDDQIFIQNSFTTQDFFEALRAVEDFIPAKTIARLHVDLENTDYYNSKLFITPRLSYAFLDTPNPSGALASFEASTLDMRSDSLGLLAKHRYPGYDYASEKGQVAHENLPIFGREVLAFGREGDNQAFVDTSSVYNVSGPYGEYAVRSASRRRDFSKGLSKGMIFDRTGYNQPSFLNGNVSGSNIDFASLGYIPSAGQFTEVSSHLNIPDVYKSCEDLNSNSTFYGIITSSTFPSRGTSLEASSSMFRYRDGYEEINKLMFDLLDTKFSLQASSILQLNQEILKDTTWFNEFQSLKNELWNDYDGDFFKEIVSNQFDFHKKFLPLEENKTLHYLYTNNYLKSGKENISDKSLESIETGGSGILSHIYGPVFYNASLNINGSGEGSVLDSNGNQVNLYTRSTGSVYEFLTTSADTTKISLRNDFKLFEDEVAIPCLLSGVEIVDSADTDQNLLSIYNLNSDEGFLDKDSILLGNNVLTMKALERAPRLRFTFNYGDPSGNYLEPESNYEAQVSSIFLNEDSMISLQKSYDVLIRTEPETLDNGQKVIWIYTPQQKWELLYLSAINQVTEKLEYLKENFTHRVSHPQKGIQSTISSDCAVNFDSNKVIYEVKHSDLFVDALKFNTVNRHIKVPLDYFSYENQVHRKDQKYVIELLPSKSLSDKDFWLLDGIRVFNSTFRSRVKLSFSFDSKVFPTGEVAEVIEADLIAATGDEDWEIVFLKQDGSLVEIGSVITIDQNGVARFVDEGTGSVSILTAVYRTAPGALVFFSRMALFESYFDPAYTNPDDVLNGLESDVVKIQIQGNYSITSYREEEQFEYLDLYDLSGTYLQPIEASSWMVEPEHQRSLTNTDLIETSSLMTFTDTGDRLRVISDDFKIFELSAFSAKIIDFPDLLDRHNDNNLLDIVTKPYSPLGFSSTEVWTSFLQDGLGANVSIPKTWAPTLDLPDKPLLEKKTGIFKPNDDIDIDQNIYTGASIHSDYPWMTANNKKHHLGKGLTQVTVEWDDFEAVSNRFDTVGNFQNTQAPNIDAHPYASLLQLGSKTVYNKPFYEHYGSETPASYAEDQAFPKLISVGDDINHFETNDYNPYFQGNYFVPNTIMYAGAKDPDGSPTKVFDTASFNTASPTVSSLPQIQQWLDTNRPDDCLIEPCFSLSSYEQDWQIPAVKQQDTSAINLEYPLLDTANWSFGCNPDRYVVSQQRLNQFINSFSDAVRSPRVEEKSIQPSYTKIDILYERSSNTSELPEFLFVGINNGELSLNPVASCQLYTLIPLKIDGTTLLPTANNPLLANLSPSEIYSRYVAEHALLRHGPHLVVRQPTETKFTDDNGYHIDFTADKRQTIYNCQYNIHNETDQNWEQMTTIPNNYKQVNSGIGANGPWYRSIQGDTITAIAEPVSVDNEGYGWYRASITIPHAGLMAVQFTDYKSEDDGDNEGPFERYWGRYVYAPTGYGDCLARSAMKCNVKHTWYAAKIIKYLDFSDTNDAFNDNVFSMDSQDSYTGTNTTGTPQMMAVKEMCRKGRYKRISIGFVDSDASQQGVGKKVKIASIKQEDITASLEFEGQTGTMRDRNTRVGTNIAYLEGFLIDNRRFGHEHTATRHTKHRIERLSPQSITDAYNFSTLRKGFVYNSNQNSGSVGVPVYEDERPFLGYSKLLGQFFNSYTFGDYAFDYDSLRFVLQSKRSLEFTVAGSNLISLDDIDTDFVIKKSFLDTEMKPEQLIVLFRYFNDLSEGVQARLSTIGEQYHGDQGGGRSNYRIHPAEFNSGSDWQTEGYGVSSIDIRN